MDARDKEGPGKQGRESSAVEAAVGEQSRAAIVRSLPHDVDRWWWYVQTSRGEGELTPGTVYRPARPGAPRARAFVDTATARSKRLGLCDPCGCVSQKAELTCFFCCNCHGNVARAHCGQPFF